MDEDTGGPGSAAAGHDADGAGPTGAGPTGAGTPGAGTPAPGQWELLGEMKALRRRTRAARHAYWFPLVLFGALICASMPFYIQRAPAGTGPSARGVTGPPLPFLGGGPDMVRGYAAYYWIAALLGGLLLTQFWYRWHARRIGLQTPARSYLLITAALIAAALTIPPLSLLQHPRWLHSLQALWPGDLVVRGTFPFLIIALGLLVLCWAERSRALAVIAAVYTGAALLANLYDVGNLTYRLGWNPAPGDESLPGVLLAGLVLLLAGAGAFLVQRRPRRAE